MDSQIRQKTADAPRQKTVGTQRQKTHWSRLILLVLLPCSLFLTPSCKENKWIDWKTQNEIWLANMARQDSVQKTESGLLYKVLRDPTPNEARPNTTSTITCHYSLHLINGAPIQENVKFATINLAGAVPGFAEGCHKVHCNGIVELYVPAYLGYDYEKYDSDKYNEAEGYGTEGTTGYIPPYSTLIFRVEVCNIVSD